MIARINALILVVLGVVSLFLSTIGGVYSSLFLFFVYSVFLSLLTQKAGSLGPLAWFPVFFFSYSSFFALNSIFFLGQPDELWLSVYLGHLALFAFSLPVLAYYFFRGMKTEQPVFYFPVQNYIFYCVWFFCFMAMGWVLSSGFTTKREVIDSSSGSVLAYLMIFFVVLGVLSTIRNVHLFSKEKRFFDWVATFSIFILLLGYGFTGERDFVFRYIFMFLIMYFTFKKKFSVIYPLAIILLLGFLLPASQALKGAVIADHVDFSIVSQRSIFENEFSSAGRNLQYVIDAGISDMNGITYLWDLKRSIPFLEGGQSTGKWFNEVLRHRYGDAGSSGWGFSLVAEGYINFGAKGVFFQYFFIGFITLLIYVFSGKNELVFIFYVFYMASLIYVQRADLANYIGFCFKVNLIVVLFIAFAVRSGKFLVGGRR